MVTRIFYSLILSIFLFQVGCTESYEIETQGYENVLVVESTITDELKNQIVKLSRTSTLDTNAVLFENNANVQIVASNGENYYFSQNPDTQFYLSNQQFRAVPNVSYTLKIKTEDGRSFTSLAINLTPEVQIDELFADKIVDGTNNKDGVEVLVTTEDPTGNAKFFRYEYEETYKVVAPNPTSYSYVIENYVGFPLTFDVILTPKTPQEICYSTEYSTGIHQIATTELNENRVFRFPVKYISKDDARILTRYSILVRQYVQSEEAYTFYRILKEMGSVQSLLSPSQPGYVVGNIISEADPNEKVVGFFEASSMNSKRIYFNYEDVGLEQPPYFVDCSVVSLDYWDNTEFDNDPDERSALRTYLMYYKYDILRVTTTGIYRIVQPECGTCTYFSSNIKPDFWED